MSGPKRNYVQRTTGKRVKGVTTILGVLHKGALIPWGYKQGIENYYRLSQEIARLLNLGDLTDAQKIEVILDYITNFDIQKLYDKRDAAANAGTLAHAFVENHLRGLPEPSRKEYTDEAIEKAEGCFLTFLDWEKNHELIVVDSEVPITSEERPCGGTIDHVIETNTSRVVASGVEIMDLKTGKDIYLEAKIQVGEYEELWEEKHPNRPVTGCHILRLGPNGEFTHRFFPTLKDYRRIFKACLVITQELDKLGERL